MSLSQRRYQLQPYAGPHTRYECPVCGARKQFTRYLDTRRQEQLPPQFGRCNREDKCGYHLGPYDVNGSGLSYAASDAAEFTTVQPGARLHKVPSPRVYVLPQELYKQSLTNYERNNFAALLCNRYGPTTANELLRRFDVGTSGLWPGATIFWQLDEFARVRGGQIVLFDAHGHTAKLQQPDGETKRCVSWVHTSMARGYDHRNAPHPDWLRDYIAHSPKSPCLYGLSQLRQAPAKQPVALVEAPKTAIICTAHYPEFLWMAVGALSYPNAERLAPLRQRQILMFPDASVGGKAYQQWTAKASLLTSQGFRVEVSDILEQVATSKCQTAGLDLADLLMSI